MLQIDSLTVGYGETTIIRDLSLHIDRGEIVAILGRNGMGKTTLLSCVDGTIGARSGTIIFNGENITELPPNERAERGITLIPQGREIFPELTVKENLQLGAYVTDGSGAIGFDDVFEYFPILEDRLSQKGGTLSGGQQQMLAIARGLLTDPDLILLDEPSEGIQPSIIHDIGKILLTIHADNDFTIVLVEQNVEFVLSTAQRGYILENGLLVEKGEIDELEADGLIQKHIGI
jgi:urea ABC transporter ATP-binding protein UrtE